VPDELPNFQELREALQAAFSEAELKLAIRETLDRSLEDVEGATRADKIGNLIRDLNSEGLLLRLLSRLWWRKPAAARLRRSLMGLVGARVGPDALIELTNLSCFDVLQWADFEPHFLKLTEDARTAPSELGIASLKTDGGRRWPEHLVVLTAFPKESSAEAAAIVPFLQWVSQEHPEHALEIDAWLDRFAAKRKPLARPRRSTRLLLIFDEVADGAFDVKAWHGEDAASLKPFEHPKGSRTKAIALGELQLAFDQICKAFAKRLGSDVAGVQVEVVLPIGRMQLLEPETWQVQLETPGAQGPLWARRMCLCVRPLERFFGRGDYEWLDWEWKDRWQCLGDEQAKTLVIDVTAFDAVPPDLAQPGVSAQLVGSSNIGAVLHPVLRAGYAIVLWVRQHKDADAVRELLGSLVSQGHEQLLTAVHAHRRSANAEQLVVLWDDPNFRPPLAPDLGIDQ
jgi:vWA-MoxR associated protein C-terminal domain